MSRAVSPHCPGGRRAGVSSAGGGTGPLHACRTAPGGVELGAPPATAPAGEEGREAGSSCSGHPCCGGRLCPAGGTALLLGAPWPSRSRPPLRAPRRRCPSLGPAAPCRSEWPSRRTRRRTVERRARRCGAAAAAARTIRGGAGALGENAGAQPGLRQGRKRSLRRSLASACGARSGAAATTHVTVRLRLMQRRREGWETREALQGGKQSLGWELLAAALAAPGLRGPPGEKGRGPAVGTGQDVSVPTARSAGPCCLDETTSLRFIAGL